MPVSVRFFLPFPFNLQAIPPTSGTERTSAQAFGPKSDRCGLRQRNAMAGLNHSPVHDQNGPPSLSSKKELPGHSYDRAVRGFC